jgi:transcriptional regulator with XRE-family HTH domain
MIKNEGSLMPLRRSPSASLGRRPEVDIRIGRNIRELRVAASMLTGDLAAKLTVPEVDILAWEAGETRVPAELFLDCARALNINPQQLIAGLDDIRGNPDGPFDYLLS